MAIVLTSREKAALDVLDPLLEQAFAEGVNDSLGGRLIAPMENYNHPRAQQHKDKIKAAFRATLAALIKSGMLTLP